MQNIQHNKPRNSKRLAQKDSQNDLKNFEFQSFTFFDFFGKF